MSPETIAVRQFLSKPPSYGGACGCLGPQRLDGLPDEYPAENILKINEYPAHLKIEVMKTIRDYLKVQLAICKDIMNGNEFEFEYSYNTKEFVEKLLDLKVTFEIKETNTGREPCCPCAMYYVELVDGNYYKISQTRVPDEGKIVFDAKLVGPVGGPYVTDFTHE